MTDEYRLRRTLTNSFRSAVRKVRSVWEEAECESDPVRKERLLGRLFAVAQTETYDFCHSISRQQDIGYPLGSAILCSCLTRDYVPVSERPSDWQWEESHAFESDDGEVDPRLLYGVPREVRSLILTACALWPYTSGRNQREPLRGKHVQHFARVMNRTADTCAKMYVEWFEDMGSGIPGIMEEMPTRMLRGILFATKLKTRDGRTPMEDFWKIAARSERFPVRIFTDPGDHNGWQCLMSPTQFAQFAEFCTNAPEEAVIRFVSAYRDAVMDMKTITYGHAKVGHGLGFSVFDVAVIDADPGEAIELFPDCGINPERVCKGDMRRRDLEVTPDKRAFLLKTAVLSHIYDPERRELVRGILFPEAENGDGKK